MVLINKKYIKIKYFTFIEFILVLSLISLISIYVIPQFTTLKNNYIQDESINNFQMTIYHTEQKALRENTKYFIVLNKDNYYIQSNDNKYKSKIFKFDKTLIYNLNSVLNDKIIINEDGTPESLYNITFSNNIKKNMITIQILPITGKVKII